jgi:acetyl-CoA synthetase (ADP-forming)
MSRKKNASKAISKAIANGRKCLLENEAKSVCREYGISTPPFRLSSTPKEAMENAKKLGFPVVMKVISPDILHKTEAGAVIVRIRNQQEARKAFTTIVQRAHNFKPTAEIRGVLVERMIDSFTEVIVGGTRDPQFGPTIMFGLGGIFAEIFQDVSFRVAPLTERDAFEMIHDVRGYPLLSGYRGRPPVDEDALMNIILNISRLMLDNPSLNQLDLNPVAITEKGPVVLDARILLA